MSVKLSSYVWDGCASAGLKITSVAIMARLADFSNDDGVCWPSVPTIARQIGAGESTVRTAIKNLEKAGWLSSEKRRKGNRNASNIYQLNVDKLASAAMAALSQPPVSDTSNSDASKSVASKSVPSESSKNNRFDPPESGGDPSVTSKHDPLVTNSSSQNSCESSDQSKIDFLNRYPEAVIYSTNFQKWGSANDLKCAEWLFERKCEVFKELGLKEPKAPNLTDWANEVRLMVSVDGHSHKEICQFYKRVIQDDFWKKNVQCPRTLRNQWDDLTLRLAGEQKVKVDAVERDEAFTRIIGSRSKPQNRIEEIASELAGKSGVRRMTDFVGRKAWAGIWQQAAEQAAKEVTA
ncbi:MULTISPECIES: helix-turn-helix domain-containing protein [Providencia]|uniref:helix-turn-helix domain-containing protein n=1 Tax=Providencia TaxID=586 RepID=UPI00029BDC2C|nr:MULTISPECIES: helix-turn-helix domain-containing protein [Providencia]EKT54482.1 phage replication protein O [Providencia rettgeri Dmel1]MBG5918992.1 helix-turn-helix domain-containing protein [Providencia stuartii]MBG5930233.1 helix-turn-helix domain-containing protein [Providencia rettgeri]MCL0020583.1 helix-turn-helix domain-containing protein [Providencia rettgeri]HEM8125392.1 helix-turn-helix domain-containing protein [Providencia rettgeri]